ncbi:hypothetical protein L915_21028 [Phytophthora nicotianae]|uniref:Uncharacterized protein n=1 Tax=Phytophthora nicotianae TaxID=4792 RepID=W2M5V1_PHYNI|nr:hypothetical protein L915_21028 [Phytophthora nicotianae]ETL25219.1 hypothetical protein L916_20904 [Phytophthora nicotianae]ETM31705.1 hypothetical protein L914_20771 [Phytophthora nicotianae]
MGTLSIVSSDSTERERAIKLLLLRRGRVTQFGSIPLTFRENKWMDDKCMGNGIALLQRAHFSIAVINPIFTRFEHREEQLQAIKAANASKRRTRSY